MFTRKAIQPLWGYDQVAAYLNTSPASVRNRVYRGQIPFVRVAARTVRFDPARIASWVAGREGLPASSCACVESKVTVTTVAPTSKIDNQAVNKQANAGSPISRNLKMAKAAGGPRGVR